MRNVLLLTVIGLLFVCQNQSFGQTDSASAVTAESRLALESKELKADAPVMKGLTVRQTQRRLPNYYTSVVTQKQRDDIRAIQNEYLPVIEMLSARLDVLRAEMSKKIRDVLSEEQQSKVDQLAEDARNRRRSNRAE